MILLGIDPGKNGAICVIKDNGEFEVKKCPETPENMAKLTQKMVENETEITCVLEKVHAMPHQGVTSMFNFGKNFGQWQGILSALGIKYKEVSPMKWQKMIGELPKEKKDRKKAIQVWVEKKVNQPVRLYASDAVAIALLARKLWRN